MVVVSVQGAFAEFREENPNQIIIVTRDLLSQLPPSVYCHANFMFRMDTKLSGYCRSIHTNFRLSRG